MHGSWRIGRIIRYCVRLDSMPVCPYDSFNRDSPAGCPTRKSIMKVGLFIPCYINQFYPKVGIATLEILEKCGVKVHYAPEQTCCGQPLANSGLEKEAIPVYKHFVEVFADYEYVVAPSASCAYHVQKHYDVIEQRPAVKHLRKNTWDLVAFLTDVLKIEDLNANFPHKVGLHKSCHGLRGLRMAQSSERALPPFSKWESLLGKVNGLEMIEVGFADECCGFGGTFAVQEAAVSAKMGRDKVNDHLSHGVEYITSGDMSCLMHLEGIIRRKKLPINVIHIAEILNSA